MKYQVVLSYFSLRVVRLWKFDSLELAHDWCNAHIPPFPALASWEIQDDKMQVVDSGPWAWEV